MAFIPVRRCEREDADSQAEAIGVTGAGVRIDGDVAVAVGDGRGVGGGAITFVSVGEGGEVRVIGEIVAAVAEGKGFRGDVTILVTVKVWVGAGVAVNEIEVSEAGTAVEFASGALASAPGVGVVEALGITVDSSVGD